MTFLALGVGAYALSALLAPSLRSPFVTSLFASAQLAITVHLAGGIIAIVVGALQLNVRLRARFLPTHRWLGRLYVIAVTASGVAGLVLALNSTGGLVSHFGFGLMATLWLLTTLMAYREVLNGRIAAHRRWMLRSYALTLAAVTLRFYLPLSQIYGIEFIAAYQTISWLCWVPNLLVVEWLILPRQSRNAASAS
jgi:uncharacterized membrane protein